MVRCVAPLEMMSSVLSSVESATCLAEDLSDRHVIHTMLWKLGDGAEVGKAHTDILASCEADPISTC
jgi:hypothetical protein